MKGRSASSYSVSPKWMIFLSIVSFCMGMFFTARMWSVPEGLDVIRPGRRDQMKLISEVHCDPKPTPMKPTEILDQVSKTHDAVWNLDRTMSALEMELAAARAKLAQESTGSPGLASPTGDSISEHRQKAFVVIGINTAFSSRKRRDTVRETWMAQGEKLKELEKKGIIIRFVIGHSGTPGSIRDRAIDAEADKFGDFLRLEHIEGYLELSAKTKIYFTTAVARWDAEFYVKVDDDVHVNIGSLVSTLSRLRSKPRVYVGCMKSGPVLAQKGVKYHEPEYWKFGEDGNKYFRHATGQLYAISRDLATYISINQPILHQYANEDVSLGAWFIGLDVNHVDERSFCCGTPPDCEWQAEAGNVCAGSFDWRCSGICEPEKNMKSVHERCWEGDDAVMNAIF